MSKPIISPELLKAMFEHRADGALVWKVKHGKVKPGDVAGCKDRDGYTLIGVNGVLCRAHRLAFLMHHGYLPSEVDHINGDPSDNRIENLRAATKSQNMCNSRTPKDNRSGVKGVYWNAHAKKWMARCTVNKKVHYIGVYADIRVAETAVKAFRKKLHGDFARHA